MTLYREDFYKIQKNKRLFRPKRFLILLITLVTFALVIFLITRWKENYEIIGIFVFDEQVLRAPLDGILRTNVREMEKVRVGQVVGYIEDTNKRTSPEEDILGDKYKDTLKTLDEIGEKINLSIDELRIEAFLGDFSRYNEIVENIKRLSFLRKEYIIKLDTIYEELQKLKKKYENLIISEKSGYAIFHIDNLVKNDLKWKTLAWEDLKKARYSYYLNRKVKKGEIIGVIRDFPPKYLVLFSKAPFERNKYLIINCNDRIIIKVKILEVEVLKNFYKISTLPIEIDNIILKERIIKGRVLKVL
ncbi:MULTISPECIES: hypothetical protein [Dictyoglomus]|uniref:Uncharacterized protein n=1 Tax=Dictyoglomus turgidum (strain DSM 6724 / Z-1310) TaxID=515635 RepID=B8E317_DICTD|nr:MULTISPECIES: hypothetical protein [Dictyoglomus]ACK42517.1 conserved hypothetical protein [Dictyoglomus turgidum DSM 6724]HBU32278.1 hypothetical protein [Dictyoglomus sp.]